MPGRAWSVTHSEINTFASSKHRTHSLSSAAATPADITGRPIVTTERPLTGSIDPALDPRIHRLY